MALFSRRLKILLLCGLLLLAAIAVTLASFDLNSYRQELAASLSRHLHQPVTIGSLHFSYAGGLALDCGELHIGDPAQSRFSLEARKISLLLRLRPLFSRQLQFKQIVLHAPVITLRPTTGSGSEKTGVAGGLGDWLEQTQINNLQLQAGRLLWHRTSAKGAPPDAELQLDLSLDGLGPNRQGHIALHGTLSGQQQASSFKLSGSIGFPARLADWQDCRTDLQGQLNNLDPSHWIALYLGHAPAWSIERIARGELHIKGSPAAGVNLALLVSGKDLALAGSDYSQPVELPPLRLQTTWQNGSDHYTFRQTSLQMGELQLNGELNIRRDDQGWLLSLQGTGKSPLEQLLGLFPDQGPLARAVHLRQHLHGGTLTLHQLQLNLPLEELPQAAGQVQFDASVGDVVIDTSSPGDLHLDQIDLAGRKGTLTVHRGELTWLGTPLQLAGQLDYAASHPGDLDLTLAGAPTAQQIAKLDPKWLNELDGTLPTRLRLTGNRSELTGELQIDFAHLNGGIGQLLQLPQPLTGSLQVRARLTAEALVFDQLQLQLPGSKLQGGGAVQLDPQHSYLLQVNLAELNLKPLQSYSPLLQRLKLAGSVQGQLQISGESASVPQLTGQLDLTGGGVHLTRVIGDLQQLTGSVALTGEGLRTVELHGLLGKSPVTLQAQIENFRQPAVRVRVQGATIRAHDLIFPSRTAQLHNLDGRLLIDRHGIRFESVSVSLPGGTKALVRGAMTGYAHAHVGLRIDADYGNIDEVIALWHHPPGFQAKPHHKPGPTVAIDIYAGQGEIGGMQFSNAHGMLKSDGIGHLVIFPIKFHSGEGYGVGQVSVDSTVDGPSLLKISGHVEDFDAAAIHRQLLHRTSLVTGVLKGDFYLEGRAGETFVATSRGGISVRISNGDLRRFQILSKVFSLLNVSQLFSFRLPDMSTEGMPFNELTATARLDHGVLSTKDLVIHSNAMDIGLVTDYDLNNGELNGVMAIKPLKTVDNLISKIPIAGWIIGGEDKALLTAQFTIKGKASDPEVTAAPVSSISRPVIGIFKRILQLPGKLASDLAGAISDQPTKPKTKSEPPARP